MSKPPRLVSHPDPQRTRELDELRASLAVERAARLRAEAADAAKDDFLMRLGHEWRTPLSAISAAADVLDGVASTDDPLAREARDIIRRQTLKLAGRIDSLLDAVRVVSGRAALSRSRVDLAAVACRAVEASHASGLAAHCELRLTRCESPVDIDPLRVGQAIEQLLDNALRFAPSGGLVEVEVGDDANGAFLRVTDDGPGMDPVAASLMFDQALHADATAFAAINGLSGVPGVRTGFGIRFVTTVMALQGGRCDVRSSSLGTCVTLHFKRAAACK